MSEIDQNCIFIIKNLNIFYQKKQKQILFNLNLKIKKNKITSLIGPSGSGKTTFLRSLNRLNELISQDLKTEGEIIFENKNIYSYNQNLTLLRSEIGIVFQKPTVFLMSIYDNITYALKCKGEKNKKILDKIVEEVLVKVSLWDEVSQRLNSEAINLSVGQQQRLCIARTLALKPKVLLMDESTSSLDPISTKKIEELIIKLKVDFTIVIVTHSMHQAARISDDVVFLLDGKLVEIGPVRKIFSKPDDLRTEYYVTNRFRKMKKIN
jgi:phosphate transport system ATP-binding protein